MINILSEMILLFIYSIGILLIGISLVFWKRAPKESDTIFLLMQTIGFLLVYIYFVAKGEILNENLMGVGILLFIGVTIHNLYKFTKLFFNLGTQNLIESNGINFVFGLLFYMIISFALINYSIYNFDNTAFMYVELSTEWYEIMMDFLHYSIFMTLTFGNTTLMPLSPLAELVSIIQLVMFILVFGKSFIKPSMLNK